MKKIKGLRNRRSKNSVKITDEVIKNATIMEMLLNSSFEALDLIEFGIKDTEKHLSMTAYQYKEVLGTIQEAFTKINDGNQVDEGANIVLDIKDSNPDMDQMSMPVWFKFLNAALSKSYKKMIPVYLSHREAVLKNSKEKALMSKQNFKSYLSKDKLNFNTKLMYIYNKIKGISLDSSYDSAVEVFISELSNNIKVES